ncbi:protein of unknown function DUF6 transmembrane [Thalassoporum mexicanum PCC 7367]|uniref:hypothetical protein n=1 Tax=Thalassoporum mexicanum TaxID=3457544 RepID=UPI00029FECB1|nr:hypothetical protein [Pseudanabaena sp. PCC 7367]AFY69848.1 protein of unknown function DUF6 transmembrane [Pseudanabaena sp. PCC 7367]
MPSPIFFLTILAIGLIVAGQILLKTGADHLGSLDTLSLIDKILKISTQPYFISGLGICAIGSVLFIVILYRSKLSTLAPLIAVSYILSVLAGIFIFGESVTGQKWLGILCIVAGVVLLITAP